jgi:shikimate dehydrogenase
VTVPLSGKAKLAGVMGWPVAHSLSPRLHNFWLAKNGIDGAYVPLAVKPEDFEAAMRALPKLGFKGCNVTIPHKEAAAKIVDHLEPLAAAIGAVNTIIVREDGSLEGRNTDAPGFIANLIETLGDWQPAGKRAVVLGAGGAARGIVAALLFQGATEITLVNRTAERAEELARSIIAAMKIEASRIRVASWDALAGETATADLLVNTTSLGQTGQPPLEIDLSPLPAHAVVTDIVYNPLETDLLKRAKARGLRTVDGLGMLIQQARPGFEAWFGVKPDADEATRAHLLAALAEKK